MTVIATREVVSRLVRAHQVDPHPDNRGRAFVCACGWWGAGRIKYADHLLAVFDEAGLELTPKDET